MNFDEKDINKIIENLALQKATDTAVHGLDHGSTICRIAGKSWEADVISKASGITHATNPRELRTAMQDPECTLIFLPAEAILTHEVIDRICHESSLNKMIIWETD